MEKLDIYDENMNYIGSRDRDEVHQNGLWHKTIHCWLYDAMGNAYFQIRKNSKKLYTSASGHVLEGETLKDAFHREVFEEIGVDVDINKAYLVEITAWRMDKIKNGKPFKDRAFANVYLNEIPSGFTNFKFDENEVLGIVKVNTKDALSLLNKDKDKISAILITNNNKSEHVKLSINDFLVQSFEIPIVKYGRILQEIIHITNQN